MVKVASLQMDGSKDNLIRAENLVAAVARAGADFAVLPELTGCAWLPAREEEPLLGLAEPDRGKTLTTLREMAASCRINLVAPVYEQSGGQRYSTAYVLDRGGAVIGKYRKNHIPYEPGWYEKFYYGPGDSGFPVFDHEGVRLGIQICWDNMFPEGTRILALKGAQLVFAPRATGHLSLGRWRTVLRANAAVNHLFVVSANRVGEDRGVQFGGGSIIAGPTGCVLGEADDKPSVLVCEVNLKEITAVARAEPFFANRRPEIYTDLVVR